MEVMSMELLVSVDSASDVGKATVDMENVNIRYNLKSSTPDTSLYSLLKGNNMLLTFIGCMPNEEVPSHCKGRVFSEYTLEGISEIPVNPSIVPLVRLPKGYNKMMELKTLSEKYSDVRFVGGSLLSVGGIKVGRYDAKPSILCDIFYDNFLELSLDELPSSTSLLQEAQNRLSLYQSKPSKTKSTKAKPKSKAKPKQNSKAAVISNLFSDLAQEF